MHGQALSASREAGGESAASAHDVSITTAADGIFEVRCTRCGLISEHVFRDSAVRPLLLHQLRAARESLPDALPGVAVDA